MKIDKIREGELGPGKMVAIAIDSNSDGSLGTDGIGIGDQMKCWTGEKRRLGDERNGN